MLDLDDFKEVNDVLGHQAGDRLLTVVADRLRESVRPTDVVARLGGDEFVVLLTGTTRDGAVATARRILAALRRPVLIDGHEVDAGASVGVAIGPGRSSTPSCAPPTRPCTRRNVIPLVTGCGSWTGRPRAGRSRRHALPPDQPGVSPRVAGYAAAGVVLHGPDAHDDGPRRRVRDPDPR
ncbi:diguanylate cyclase domain-containing protein [Catellatospora bangladeshensis]|uniref:diguanylate cyclase domain-containing protein n=1 Tax=Catellatospora bangladeshensis TaxID=310355 RepID=UPI0036135AFF